MRRVSLTLMGCALAAALCAVGACGGGGGGGGTGGGGGGGGASNLIVLGGSWAAWFSQDGLSWTESTSIEANPGAVWASVVGGGRVVVGGSSLGVGATIWGTSGLTDAFQRPPFGFAGNGVVRDAAYGGGQYIFVKDDHAPLVYTSTDAVAWTASAGTGLTATALWAAAYGSGVFVVAGNTSTGRAAWVSSDAQTWTRYFGVGRVLDMEFADAMFMAVGNHATSGAPRAWRSANGTSWTGAAMGGDPAPRGIAFGNGIWVAVGSGGQTWRSVDGGASWTNKVINAVRWHDVTYSNGLFIAVGEGAAIATSADGSSWSISSLPGGVGSDLYAVSSTE